jgi:hypothetical protein
MILTELRSMGIKALEYADDGLLYGDKPGDYLSILQSLFDKYGTGVKVHPVKSA